MKHHKRLLRKITESEFIEEESRNSGQRWSLRWTWLKVDFCMTERILRMNCSRKTPAELDIDGGNALRYRGDPILNTSPEVKRSVSGVARIIGPSTGQFDIFVGRTTETGDIFVSEIGGDFGIVLEEFVDGADSLESISAFFGGEHEKGCKLTLPVPARVLEETYSAWDRNTSAKVSIDLQIFGPYRPPNDGRGIVIPDDGGLVILDREKRVYVESVRIQDGNQPGR